MVLSGSPSPPQRRVSSYPSMVPTVRLTLRTGKSRRTGEPSSSDPSASAMSVLSSALSSPWSCSLIRCRGTSASAMDGTCRIGDKSSPAAFQWSIAGRVSSISVRPTASSRLRNPSAARYSRTSWAMNSKKLTTNSAWPVNFARSVGFWVATPTGQVSR